MPSQLIYSSVPRGLTPGQSGYCTVAQSKELRPALIPHLEKLSYYAVGDDAPVICAYRIVEMRGARFHVLSRICNAGLDFTKRKSFLAHHLVFTPEELPGVSPALIFLRWNGWRTKWEGEPQTLEVSSGFELEGASAWEQLTGSADNAPALLETQWVTGDAEDRKLFLAALDESLRSSGKSLWGITFTNYFQKGDATADFRIKGIWTEAPVGAVRLRALRSTQKRAVAAAPTASGKSETAGEKPKTARKRSLMPIFAIAPMVVLIAAILILKRQTSEKAVAAVPGSSTEATPGASINVDSAFAKIAADGRLQLSNTPVHLPKDLVVIDAKNQLAFLHEEFGKRLKALNLPDGATLALRPEKDFVAALAEDFGLMPAALFDLNAIRSQVERVISEEQKSVREREEELAGLEAKEKELVTSPQSEEELKRAERLKILKQGVPEDQKEMAELRKKAALVPKDIRQSGSFSLFLCQKNVNQEIIRFDEEPELVRVVSP
jgi:hypothetical protein